MPARPLLSYANLVVTINLHPGPNCDETSERGFWKQWLELDVEGIATKAIEPALIEAMTKALKEKVPALPDFELEIDIFEEN